MIEIGKEYLHRNSVVIATCILPMSGDSQDNVTVRWVDRFENAGECKASELEPWEPKTEKRPRLFARTPGSDGAWWHCGGPDPDDAIKGLANILRSDVEELLSPRGLPDSDVELEAFHMTDEEVAILPEA